MYYAPELPAVDQEILVENDSLETDPARGAKVRKVDPEAEFPLLAAEIP